MQIWSAILSNTKTAEEIRDGSPSFTIRLVLVKNVTLKKFKVVNHCQIQRQRRRFVTGVQALLSGFSWLKCHLEERREARRRGAKQDEGNAKQRICDEVDAKWTRLRDAQQDTKQDAK